MRIVLSRCFIILLINEKIVNVRINSAPQKNFEKTASKHGRRGACRGLVNRFLEIKYIKLRLKIIFKVSPCSSCHKDHENTNIL